MYSFIDNSLNMYFIHNSTLGCVWGKQSDQLLCVGNLVIKRKDE